MQAGMSFAKICYGNLCDYEPKTRESNSALSGMPERDPDPVPLAATTTRVSTFCPSCL